MRPRTPAIVMTSNSKRAICEEIGIDKLQGDEDKRLRLKEYLMNNYQERDTDDKADFSIDNITPPDYIGKSKTFGQTEEHIPIQFHQKGKIVNFGYETQTILTHSHKMDFNRFALISSIEPDKVNVEELLGVNFDNIAEGKEILNELIDNTRHSHMSDEHKERMIKYFRSKISQLEANEDNVRKFIANMENVNHISFGQETTVYFNMNK